MSRGKSLFFNCIFLAYAKKVFTKVFEYSPGERNNMVYYLGKALYVIIFFLLNSRFWISQISLIAKTLEFERYIVSIIDR